MRHIVAARSGNDAASEIRELIRLLLLENVLTICRPPKTSPYSQSVDMWSLGAVLYHILCGIPPYSGRAEDRGVQMLRSIMETEADYDVLRRAGVSESGIDFVARLLNRDPFARPTEKDCFQHPWIADVPDVDEYEDDDILADPREGLSVIGEDAEEELDASQLSIHDDPAYTYGADAEESSSNEALAKRPRIEHIPTDIRYPSLPQIESFQDGQALAEQQARRLFGEINASALRSSHALGHTGSWNGAEFEIEGLTSSGESMSDEHSVYSIMSLPPQPFGGTAPSLMGAENLVGQLNMNSSHPLLHPQTGPINDITERQNNPGTPTASANAGGNSNHEGRVPSSDNAVDTTPKARMPSRRIEAELPDTASERSSINSGQLSRQGSAAPPDRASKADFDVELATTLDAQTGQAILEQLRTADIEASEPIVHQPDGPFLAPILPATEFAKPPKILGRLKSVPGSIFDVNIRLENRMTSWGRGPEATIRHPDRMDVRIPAYALEITFWAPGLERKIAEGQDWLEVEGVMAVLSTKTRKCIWVNGKELRKGGPEGLQFGKLYSGDVITVYQHKEQYLQLQCEFYHGESKQPRPAQEPEFVVRQALVGKSDGSANRLPIRADRKKVEK